MERCRPVRPCLFSLSRGSETISWITQQLVLWVADTLLSHWRLHVYHRDGSRRVEIPYWQNVEVEATLDRSLVMKELFPHNLPRLFIVTQSGETSVPQVRVRRPFRELDLGDKLRLQPAALFHLTHRQRPHTVQRFSGRLTKEHLAVTNPVNLLKTSQWT